jgi:hypothetical protein
MNWTEARKLRVNNPCGICGNCGYVISYGTGYACLWEDGVWRLVCPECVDKPYKEVQPSTGRMTSMKENFENIYKGDKQIPNWEDEVLNLLQFVEEAFRDSNSFREVHAANIIKHEILVLLDKMGVDISVQEKE